MSYEVVAEFSIETCVKNKLFDVFTSYLRKYGAMRGFNEMAGDDPGGLISELGFDVCYTVIFSDWYGNYMWGRERKHRAPSKIKQGEWEKLQAKYNNRCFYCGKRDIRLTKDHVIPVSKGGEDIIENIVPACMACNRKKGAKILS